MIHLAHDSTLGSVVVAVTGADASNVDGADGVGGTMAVAPGLWC